MTDVLRARLDPLLEGATVTRAQSGHAAGLPLPLSATKVGARVALRVVGQKGMRSGTHQIRFSYRTNLEAAGKLAQMEAPATVRVEGGQATLPLALPRQAVSLIVLEW